MDTDELRRMLVEQFDTLTQKEQQQLIEQLKNKK